MQTPQPKAAPKTNATRRVKPNGSSNTAASSTIATAERQTTADKETVEQYAERAEGRHTPGMRHGKKAMLDRDQAD